MERQFFSTGGPALLHNLQRLLLFRISLRPCLSARGPVLPDGFQKLSCFGISIRCDVQVMVKVC